MIDGRSFKEVLKERTKRGAYGTSPNQQRSKGRSRENGNGAKEGRKEGKKEEKVIIVNGELSQEDVEWLSKSIIIETRS